MTPEQDEICIQLGYKEMYDLCLRTTGVSVLTYAKNEIYAIACFKTGHAMPDQKSTLVADCYFVNERR
jgi:hypothetical protein